MSTTTTPRILNPDQVCKLLQIKKSRFYYMTSTGQIPFFKIGASVRVREDRLVQWLAEMEQRKN